MFRDILLIVIDCLDGNEEYTVWGFESKSNADALNQAVLQADNLNSESKDRKFTVEDVGPAGSFDHLMGQRPN